MLKKGLLVLLCCSAASLALANDGFLETGQFVSTNPSSNESATVQIFNRHNVGNEYNAVRFFFTYTCPYGEKYDEEMAVWGRTLPKPFKYVRVPVITQEPNSLIGAFAYYSAWVADKAKVDEFQKQAYQIIKVQQKDPSDQFTYLTAAIRAGYSGPAYKKAWGDKKTLRLVQNAAILGSKYKVAYTPTLTVGGLYSLNPEPIAESKTSFIDFANAITSKYISENRTAIQ